MFIAVFNNIFFTVVGIYTLNENTFLFFYCIPWFSCWGLFVESCLNHPIQIASVGRARGVFAWKDPPTKRWTSDIFPQRPLPWNRNTYPCFYIFPLEFVGVGDLRTHHNRRVICLNCNNPSIKTPVRPRLRIHGKHVYKFHPYKSAWYLSHAEHFILNKRDVAVWKRLGCPPV